ncbi:ornithine carbamoyltransferase [Desulfatiglans anilini]|uniref:ornithine carbamoyltransferase n=1 Tax=Desulfatiglans anilini TaxID=90728 RepID=UPI0004099A7D|nr:ornithine carbamoyltransferase [Desulfatiglans anilini]
MKKKDFLTIRDWAPDEIMDVIQQALTLKQGGRDARRRPLEGYTLGLMFDKASTRTRVSFEVAMLRAGGGTIFLSRHDTQLSRNEALKDTAQVLSRYLDVLAIRTYSQEWVQEVARWADIPVINALTDLYHPCQILSDLMTVKEKKGSVRNLKIAWVGDGNNVAHSWIHAARKLGFELVLACPPGYAPKPEILGDGAPNIRLTADPAEAVQGADVLNTDVWTSMGQDAEREKRLQDFSGFQINETLVARARPDVIVMHCLPAHRGEEIASEVLDGPRSVVLDQAENKMYLHQALLETLLLA